MREFGYLRESDGVGHQIDVESGFLTDFASVPWFVQWWIPKWGKYGSPAVVHDWLYWRQTTSREDADNILLDAMHVAGVDVVRKYAIYWAVRCCGGVAWLRNSEDRLSGFDRVMPVAALAQNTQSLRARSLRQVFRAIGRRLQRSN